MDVISPHTAKQALQTKILKATLKALNRGSDESIIRFAEMLKAFAPPIERHRLSTLQKLIREQHPGVRLVRRFLDEIDPDIQAKYIRNLILEGILNRQSRRDAIVAADAATLFTILISPTARCNLRCTGCYASSYTRETDLPFEVMDRVIREAKEWSTAFITILGGEPFVRQDLLDLFARHNDMTFNVFTNATLIDESLAQALRDLGNVVLQVSIEGFAEKTDARRGAGTYERVMAALEHIGQYRLPFGYSVCVTRHNVEEVVSDAFVDMMIEKGAMIGWYFLYMPTCGDTNLDLMPTPEQRNYLRERRREIRNKKPLFIIDFWNDAPYVGGCIAGRDYMHITNYGDVEPCIFTHFAQMNIKNHSLREVASSQFFRELRKRQPYSENLLRPCMLIDHPEVSREVISLCACYPTHPGATTLFNELKEDIEAYASRVAELYDAVWELERPIVDKDKADHAVPDRPEPKHEARGAARLRAR